MINDVKYIQIKYSNASTRLSIYNTIIFFNKNMHIRFLVSLSLSITKHQMFLFTLIHMGNDRHLAVSINDYIWIALLFDQSIKN